MDRARCWGGFGAPFAVSGHGEATDRDHARPLAAPRTTTTEPMRSCRWTFSHVATKESSGLHTTMDGSQSQRYLRDAKAKMRAEEAQFAQRLRQGRKHQLSVAAARISQMNGWAEQLKDDRRFDLKVESSGSDSDDSDSGRTHRAIESSTG